MASIEEQVEITAPPSTVFRFCHDAIKRAGWDERVVRIEILTRGPIRQGTLVRIDTGRPGKPIFSWDGEYSEYQFPLSSATKVLDAAPSSPFKAGIERWEFGATGNGTRLTLVWDYTPRSFISRIADFLWMRSATRRDIRRSLENLKAAVEAD